MMKIDDKIRDEKLQYDIKREAAKRWALSYEKIDKYEYHTGEEIEEWSSWSKKSDRTSKVCILSISKSFWKQMTIIEDQRKKQINAITNQNKRLQALTNKDDHKSIYKEIFIIM